jgi:transposase
MHQKFEPVGDIRGRDFAAWLGLVPRQYSTGGKSILGRSQNGAAPISGRFLSVILMRPKNWDRFSFGSWLKASAIRLHKNKLAITLANKPAAHWLERFEARHGIR